ncbi:MAG: amidoligase family protein [Acidimicrobiales bacterium]
MVCRERPGGSASTSLAQQLTRLPANAVLSLSHQLRHEGRDAPGPDRNEVAEWARRTAERVRANTALSEARRRSIAERLEAVADDGEVDGAEFYAWRNMVERAAESARSIDAHIRRLAVRLGLTEDEVRAAYDELYRRADGRSTGIEAPREWSERFCSDPDNGVIPRDRGTLYAFHELYARAGLTRPSDVRPLRRPVPGRAGTVHAVGYDRASGRLDVERSNGDVDTYHNVPASVYEEMVSPGADPDRIYYTRLLGRSGGPVQVVRRGSPQDRQRCPDCGQFCDASHVCPSPGAVNGTPGAPRVRMGQVAGTGSGAGDGADGAAVADQAPPQAPSSPRVPRLVMAPTRRVAGADFAMVVPSRADVGAFASEHPEFDLPLAAEPDDGSGLVTGRARVVTDPATGYLSVTGGDLECTCEAFGRDGLCAHTAGALAGLRAHISGRRGEGSLRSVSMGQAQVQAGGHLQAEVLPQAPAEVLYGADMGAFQAAYDAARARLRAGQSPVEFHPEGGVTGGAAAPGRRGFGIEIEFSCTSAAAREAIARELYEAGLIRQPVQVNYHGTQREARSGLWDRWGFERDGSVSGGEVVSPVLFDRPEDWAELATVCRIVRSHGGTVDSSTGCHVHVGAGDFGTTPEAHNALLAEVRDNEDLMYRLAQRPGAGRHRMNGYSSPAYIPPNGYATVAEVRDRQSGHNRPLNFGAVSGQPSDHVELRIWDGTLDPGAIQAQVAISVGMVEAARAGRTCPPGQGSGQVGDHRAANAGRGTLRGEDWQADTAPFRHFADRALATPVAKAQAAALYAASRWSAPSRHRRR